MQIDPTTGTTVFVATQGGDLTLDPGRQVVARVVGMDAEGQTQISLAGQTLSVQSDARLRVGDTINLTVTQADATGVRLAITGPAAPGGEQSGLGGNLAGGFGGGGALIRELARAGVQVTPQIANTVGIVAEQLGGGSSAARAVANLASRDIALSPAAATRVAAALDLAGSIGPSLASLAARSDSVAAALPGGPPSAAALRSLLAPNLSHSELAVARIVQATQASAPNGPMMLPTPPATTSTSVMQNYVSSQVAATTSLDDLAAQNTLLGNANTLTTGQSGAQTSASGAGATGLAPAALQAALRGQAAGGEAGAGANGQGAQGAQNGGLQQPSALASSLTASATASEAAPIRASASAAAATGSANATASPTNPRAAQAVVDLATLATRFAGAVAGAAGAVGDAANAASRGMNATDIAQQAGAPGATGAGAASVAGAGADGDPAPIVTALRAFLNSPGAEGDAARLMRTLSTADPALLRAAIQTLPESQSLQLAGQLLDMLPSGAQLPGTAAQQLRHGVHAALHHLGQALAGPGGDDVTALRHALEQVAATDPRPAVAGDAARLLSALDGQQILSRTASGADPGYVYFQVPMPNGQGAEVMVRREPGRRNVSFDEFNIAFLLDTQHIGTLMIQLDANPAGIRADVRTNLPELEPFLRARTEDLVGPLGRESRRPVTVTTGVFDQTPPKSLLEPQLGLIPGANEFYV